MTRQEIQSIVATVCRANDCRVLRPKIVFSKKMTRVLGKSVYSRKELRFSSVKFAGLTAAEQRQVVAHEAAHYVSSHLHGDAEASRVNGGHDRRWSTILTNAGFRDEQHFVPDAVRAMRQWTPVKRPSAWARLLAFVGLR